MSVDMEDIEDRARARERDQGVILGELDSEKTEEIDTVCMVYGSQRHIIDAASSCYVACLCGSEDIQSQLSLLRLSIVVVVWYDHNKEHIRSTLPRRAVAKSETQRQLSFQQRKITLNPLVLFCCACNPRNVVTRCIDH